MPILSTRAYAEMINLPAYEQLRILNEQKFPKDNQSKFKMPYYATALAGIRNYFKIDNNSAAIKNALDKTALLKGPGKAPHNARILNTFFNGHIATRKFENISLKVNLTGSPGLDVIIKLKFDLEGDEKGNRKYIFFNCRDVPLDPQVATDTLSIAHWIFLQNGMNVTQNCIEYYDFKTGISLKISKPSVKSIKKMIDNARVISSLWPNV